MFDPRCPCPFPCGSLRKQVWLRARARLGVPLFNPLDCSLIASQPTQQRQHHVSQFRRSMIVALLARGKKQVDIAAELGVSPQSICSAIARHHLR